MNKFELKIRLLVGIVSAVLITVVVIGVRRAVEHIPLDVEPVIATGTTGTTATNGTSASPGPERATASDTQSQSRAERATVGDVPAANTSVGANHVAAPVDIPDPSKTAHSGCFTAKFQHSRAPGHQTKEECSKHQNELVLSEQNGLVRAFQEKSKVCLKVDGHVVDFEKKGNRIIFANVAGPDSVLTIRYCLGTSKCSEPCGPPKDSFMNALGDSGEDEQPTQANAQWDPSDKDDGDVGAEYADLLEAEKKQARAGLALSTDWVPEAISSGCSATSVTSR